MKLKGVEFVDVKEIKPMAAIKPVGENSDIYIDGKNSSTKLTEGGVEIYSWGKNNKLPAEMIALALSNGDLGNLLNTKKDFLYGAGVQLFIATSEGVKPYQSRKARKVINDWGINSMVRQIICSLVDCNFAPINISKVNVGGPRFRALDPLTIRAGYTKGQTKIDRYVHSPSWPLDTQAGHKATPTPVYDPAKDLPESIYILREYQTGLPIYGRPIWWSIAEWVKLANRIPTFYNDSMDTEGNMGHVVRIAQDLLVKLQENAGVNKVTGELESLKKIQDTLMQKLDKFLYGTGKQRRVVDTCVTVNGQMVKGLEFEPIKKSFTGKEYMDLYAACITAITNACQVLGGLAGVSDGKMNSGGGTEIRTAAEFQQFYRTPRIRAEITEFLNKHLLDDFLTAIGYTGDEDIYFDFGNIQLTTLTKDHTSNNKNTITGTAA